MEPTDRTAIIAIRPATVDDASAVARLAVLDSSPLPAGDLLLGVADGQPLVALSLTTGAVVADPFAWTEELRALVEQRARRLRPAPPRRLRVPHRPVLRRLAA